MIALAAALPLLVLLGALLIWRSSAAAASAPALLVALLIAVFVFKMPVGQAVSAGLYGAAFGTFPIFWIVYWAIVLYRITIETGKFEVIRTSISSLTTDRGVQALLIAFAFGAFLEGAAGFGTPVAVSAAILSGLQFEPFYAAAICLLANTAPVAFGSLAIPLVTLAAATGLPIADLSRDVGRLCAPLSLLIPAYLIAVMGGSKGLQRLWPYAAVCGVSFAGVQFAISNFVGPYLTDILSSIAAMVSLVGMLWRDRSRRNALQGVAARQILIAWTPYLLLVAAILLWSVPAVKSLLERGTWVIEWPDLPRPATYRLRLLAEAGTACAVAALLSAALLRVSLPRLGKIARDAALQLRMPYLSIIGVLSLAFILNYSGAMLALGDAFASTGKLFPFFGALLGWIGVFLTGSDTSSNALFGPLQAAAAHRLGYSPVLQASANSAGGVMGKMISLQSIAVAAAAAGLKRSDEARLFRFTLGHSILLACAVGLVTLLFSR